MEHDKGGDGDLLCLRDEGACGRRIVERWGPCDKGAV